MFAPTLQETDREAAAEAEGARYEDLYGECFSALLNDPSALIATPGWARGEAPAFDVLYDEMAGVGSDDMRTRLARIVAWAATQRSDAAQQEAALRFLMDVAAGHADSRSGLS